MAQRNPFNPRAQSIDSTIRDSSPRPERSSSRGNVDDEGSERPAILSDVERSASPSLSTWSSENPETNPFNTTQSANSAVPQRRESTVASSESDSLNPSHDTPRSQSNLSGHGRWSYQRIPSLSNLEIGRTLPEYHLQEDFETLTERQDAIPTHRPNDRPRIPTTEELRTLPVKARMIPPKGRKTWKISSSSYMIIPGMRTFFKTLQRRTFDRKILLVSCFEESARWQRKKTATNGRITSILS